MINVLVVSLVLCVGLLILQRMQYIKVMALKEKENLEKELILLSHEHNPHFLYNTLNSIKNMMLKHQSFQAAEYLSKFANIVRLKLNGLSEVYANLDSELDQLMNYIELENIRFKDGLNFTCYLDKDIDKKETLIPAYFMQPLMEYLIFNTFITKQENAAELYLGLERIDLSLQITIRINATLKDLGNNNINGTRDLFFKNLINKRISIFNRINYHKIEYDEIGLLDERKNKFGSEIMISLPIRTKK